MFCVNLSFQNAVRVLGVDAFLHEACRCQKQPCTKMAHVLAGIQMSGLPGSER